MTHLVSPQKALHLSLKSRHSRLQMRTMIGPHHPLVRRGINKEVDPSKDRTSESSYSQVKSQVETLTEKMCIMKSSGSQRNVDLDSLTNFPQVVMPSSSSRLSFSSMMALETHAPICACSIERWHPMGTINPYSTKSSLIA